MNGSKCSDRIRSEEQPQWRMGRNPSGWNDAENALRPPSHGRESTRENVFQRINKNYCMRRQRHRRCGERKKYKWKRKRINSHETQGKNTQPTRRHISSFLLMSDDAREKMSCQLFRFGRVNRLNSFPHAHFGSYSDCSRPSSHARSLLPSAASGLCRLFKTRTFVFLFSIFQLFPRTRKVRD